MALRAEPAGPLCVALDDPDPGVCERLAEQTRPYAGAFKVGLTAFYSGGPALVRSVAARRPLFLDLKLHDIPAQVEGAAAAAAGLEASYLTVHAAGGADMVRAAVRGADPGVVLAVTVLTSISQVELTTLGVPSSVQDHVVRLADLSLASGAGGLVCSAGEAHVLRERFGARSAGGPLLVVPGIRTPPEPADDQRRAASARHALEQGADLLVVGRPITRAADPAAEARRFHQQLPGGAAVIPEPDRGVTT